MHSNKQIRHVHPCPCGWPRPLWSDTEAADIPTKILTFALMLTVKASLRMH